MLILDTEYIKLFLFVFTLIWGLKYYNKVILQDIKIIACKTDNIPPAPLRGSQRHTTNTLSVSIDLN